MTIRQRLQAALDTTGIKSFWKRRAKIKGDKEPLEYIVYTLEGDIGTMFADGAPLQKEASATVRYYCQSDRFGTEAGRVAAEQKIRDILSALSSAGFDTPSDVFDSGDIDENGYDASIIECTYGRVVIT